MFHLDTAALVLIGITLLAAFVNGALGYGFSSLTVPVALVFFTNRLLNPALVVVEVILNWYMLFVNRRSIGAIWKRVLPIMIGLVPGVAVGSYLLASLQPGWIKFITYIVLLPLILIQAAGLRRPLRSEQLFGLPFGSLLGFLYSVTTISGPPMAVLFNNQGFVKKDFRAGVALIRVAESTLTAIVYAQLGLFVVNSQVVLWTIVPSVLVGVPLGAYLIRKLDAETFRRVCMSFDAWVVGFGLSRVLLELKLMSGPGVYSVMAGTIVVDLLLLYRFFTVQRPAALRAGLVQAPLGGSGGAS